MTPAQQLGPYRLIERIGRGGMGEVWKARDTRLDREVAVKVSAEQFSDRFEREARAIAALNHPNICTLFDVGPNYLVMELIDGPTLADRIAEGPIPLEEALAIARQIADALEAAHEKNIVHRDLKPANIKLRAGGSVKVLDFGLAKASGPETIVTGDSPTMLHTPTQIGVILGTAAYMAPEQARGKNVDKRADIWSFGVVLHEMVTGKRTFEGEDLTDTLASVVKSDPDLTVIPHQVRRLLAKCLQKDPKKRLRDIGDAWDYLDAPADSVTAPSQSRLSIGWIAAGVLALAFAALSLHDFRETAPQQLPTSLSVTLPADALPGFLEISPDGTRLVILLFRSDPEKSLLYVRSLSSNELKPLAGTTFARAPFWSPDGQSIGFFTMDGKLKVIPASGGPARTLCDATTDGAGAWNREGIILFGTRNQLWRTTADGGACTALGTPTGPVGTPIFLPDGNRFFYTQTAPDNMAGVYLTSLDDAKDGKLKGRRILTDRSSVLYAAPAPGSRRAYLLFVREHSLMAQPFDDSTMQTTGDAIVLDDHASSSFSAPQAAATVSARGTLAWIADLPRNQVPTWLDQTGRELGRVGSVREQEGVSLSPDGNFVSSGRIATGGRSAWWVFDSERNSESPLTSDDETASPPVWLPDSRTIVQSVRSSPGRGLYERDVLSGHRQPLRQEAGDKWLPSDVSRDGRYLIFNRTDPKTQADIWYARIEGEKIAGEPVRLVATPGVDSQGQLSPDGKWLAYFSGEGGGAHVYIRPFPEGEAKWKVSGEFGVEPRWLPGGKELCFLGRPPAGPTPLMCVTVEPDGHAGLRIGTPRKMFDFSTFGVVPQADVWSWSPGPDGKRFLVSAIVRDVPTTVNVMQNWQAALKK